MTSPTYKPFHIADLGIDATSFLNHVRPIYETLQWDPFDTDRGGLSKPTRKRAVAEVVVKRRDRMWEVTRVPAQPYAQNTNHEDYDRTTPRQYPEPQQLAIAHLEFTRLMQGVSDMVADVREGVEKLRLILTFLRAVDDDDRPGVCALEGTPHSDGMEFIVSALVINRCNLTPDSGASSVYDLNGNKLYESVLQPGEGILQDDLNLLHHISDISRQDSSQLGFRDMLGIDFVINPQ